MKKYPVLILLLLLIHTVLSAQDYRNIITNGSAFYSGSTNEEGFLSGIKAGSKTSLGYGDTLFMMTNTIRPSVLSAILDTAGGIFGSMIMKMNNGWFYFFNASGDTIFLNSNAALNDSWKFCNLPLKCHIQAKCTAVQTMPLPGSTDLVKVITFEAQDSNGVHIPNFYNATSIHLSRQFGLTKTFDLYHFPGTTAVYTLEGKNSPPVGFQGLTWHDVYDFEVGDEFHVTGHTNYLWGSHPSAKDYKIIRKVLAKQVAAGQGSVTYTFEYCKEETDFNPILGPTISYAHDTILLSYPYSASLADPSINWIPETFTHTDYRYYSTLHHLVPGRPAYGHSGNYYNCCWGLNPYFNMYVKDDREYTRGLGQVHYKNYWRYIDLVKYDDENLVYCKKGNDVWGSPVNTDCSAMAPHLSISPDTVFLDNPAGSSGTFNISTNRSWTITNAYSDAAFGYSPASGSGNAAVTVWANSADTNYYARKGKLFIDGPAGQKTIMIIQEGKSSGVESKVAVNLKISPNPMNKTAVLTFSGLAENQEKQLTLFDVTGRRVFEDSFHAEAYLFDRGTLTGGIYLLKVRYNKDKPPLIVKVILE